MNRTRNGALEMVLRQLGGVPWNERLLEGLSPKSTARCSNEVNQSLSCALIAPLLSLDFPFPARLHIAYVHDNALYAPPLAERQYAGIGELPTGEDNGAFAGIAVAETEAGMRSFVEEMRLDDMVVEEVSFDDACALVRLKPLTVVALILIDHPDRPLHFVR